MSDDRERLDNNNPEETVIRNVQFDDTVLITTPDEEIEEEIPSVYNSTDPYEEQDLRTVLSRPWPIRNFLWNDSSNANAYILQFSPGYDLLNFSFNEEKLRNFSFVRASLRISVRLNTTPFHAGMLLIVYAPEMDSALVNAPKTIHEASLYPSRLISAGAQQTVDFIIPYVHPEDYMPTVTSANNIFGWVQVWALTPLLSGNGTSSATQVQIFANFEDIEIAGMHL